MEKREELPCHSKYDQILPITSWSPTKFLFSPHKRLSPLDYYQKLDIKV